MKVAWVQQYALKMPPATPCTLMLWGTEEMTTCYLDITGDGVGDQLDGGDQEAARQEQPRGQLNSLHAAVN